MIKLTKLSDQYNNIKIYLSAFCKIECINDEKDKGERPKFTYAFFFFIVYLYG